MQIALETTLLHKKASDVFYAFKHTMYLICIYVFKYVLSSLQKLSKNVSWTHGDISKNGHYAYKVILRLIGLPNL